MSTAGPGETTGSGWLSAQVEAMAAAWDRGERVSAAEVIGRRPGIDTESAVRLIFEEACLAREAGLEVRTTEVVARYPRWAEPLRALFECDRMLRPSGLASSFPDTGDTLGRFRLIGELGRGASGRTYLATDPDLADRPVVLKVIPDDQDEHLALARLRHTHIVPLFSEQTFSDRGLRALCMPYLGGASLAQVLLDLGGTPAAQRTGRQLVEAVDVHTRKFPSPPPADGPYRRGLEQATYDRAVTWIAACLADALHYAHARGLVHMDLKPSNVLIAADGQPMLLDFHLARAPIVAGEWVTDRLGGTPGWMAPEQREALRAVVDGRPTPRRVDGRADIYALGLLIREALVPGSGSNPPDAPTDPLRGQPGLSVGLADLVRKCVAADPDQRYQDAAALAEDLRRHLNDLPFQGVANRDPLERWRKWRRRHPGAHAWWFAGLALGFAAVVGLSAAAWIHRQRLEAARTSLDEGRAAVAAGRFDRAVQAFERGKAAIRDWPAAGELPGELDDALQHAHLAAAANELHNLADQIRFRYADQLPPGDDARALADHCRRVWDARGPLLQASDRLGVALDRQVRTDLVEVVAVWTDLLAGLARAGGTSGSDVDAARAQAGAVLAEASRGLGPSPALDARRRRLAGFPDPRPPAPAPAPSGYDDDPWKTAWEHYDLGRLLLRSGRFEAASGEFRRALALRPQDFWSNFFDGLCSYRLGRWEEAVGAFRTCVALAPGLADAYFSRALVYEALGRTDDARRDYTKALALDGDHARAGLNRGLLALRAGRHREAAEDFERALRSPAADTPTRARLHHNLGLALRGLGEPDAARRHAREAQRLGFDPAPGR